MTISAEAAQGPDIGGEATSRLKRALVALDKLRQRLDDSEREPIAVIGLGCRFPGGAHDAQSLWQLLSEGRDPISTVPAERWDLESYYDPDPDAPGKMYTRRGGFLDGVREFDAEFFGISPREALSMDPQQRLLLEVSWEALEDAGQRPDLLTGSKTGVFVGFFSFDYYNRQVKLGGEALIDAYTGTGNTASVAAGRISYALGLQGPSIAVDSACSSSLVAVHLACQSLRSRESDLALVGGVNLMLTPDRTVYFCKLKAMAADGRCKAFDAAADGYVRGEGCGIVVLKRRSDALRDGDRILALIRGSACNQDGRSQGLTAPNGPAQEAVIRRALANAGLSPSDVSYVEAHGSGTPLGDPIELHALGRAYAEGRAPERPLLVGSVKTNFGHTEAAAGIAGFIKAVLCLEQRAIPPHLHLERPSPNIRWSELPVTVPTKLTTWPEQSPLRAGVNSFGFSGTNAHVILEAVEPGAARAAAPGPSLLPLSAREPGALRELAQRWLAFLPSVAASAWPDVLYTAALRRAHLEQRLAVVAASPAELAEQLSAFVAGESRPGLTAGAATPGLRRKIVFVFPGQGSQWRGMGRALLQQEPTFAQTVERCGQAFAPYGLGGLRSILLEADASAFERIDTLQPLLFAIQLALAETWRSLGVEPDAVVGHSMGEVAAACFAGALTLEDAARVICLRSRLLREISGRGAMLAAELALPEARGALRGREDKVSIAACNGPRATILSGDRAALTEIMSELERAGTFCRWVKVDVASHSPQIDPLGSRLLAALSETQPRESRLPFHSTVDDGVCSGLELDARYWLKNLREPVLFWSAVERLLRADHDVFVEISPHPILLPALRDGMSELAREGLALPSLRREEDDRAVLLESLGALHTVGQPVEWTKLVPQGAPVALPGYPWAREQHWLELEASARESNGPSWVGPLVPGRRLHTPLRDVLFETLLSVERTPFFGEHRLHGHAVVPGAFHLVLALAAAAAAFPEKPRFSIEDAFFPQALVLPEAWARMAQAVLKVGDDGSVKALVYSAEAGAEPAAPAPWSQHFDARLQQLDAESAGARHELEAARARCREVLDGDAFYETMWQRGYHFGDGFRTVASLWLGDGEVVAAVRLPRSQDASQRTISLVDLLLQLPAAAFPKGHFSTTLVPAAFERFTWSEPPAGPLFAHVTLRPAQGDKIPLVDGWLVDAEGRPFAELRGLEARPAERERFESRRALPNELLFQLEWRRAESLGPGAVKAPTPAGNWIAVGSGSDSELVSALNAEATERGGRVDPVRGEPASPEMLADFESRLAAQDVSLRGVFFVWPGDERDSEGASPSTACEALLALVQALARHPRSEPVRLVIVTRGTQSAGATEIRLSGAPLWGFAASLTLEHPEFTTLIIDLPTEPLVDEGRRIWDALENAQESRLALRSDGWYLARLVRVATPRRTATGGVRADASYVLSGGYGAIGLLLAEELAARGARHLVLVGRRGPGAAAAAALGRLAESGCTVDARAVDVTNQKEVAKLFAELRDKAPPVRGIFHVAAVLDDGILLEQSRERFRNVLAPKVDGARALDLESRGLELDHFVLFSSAAAWLGAQGQAAYAAGNDYLNALARGRRSRGLPGLSINWGPWAQVGLAAAQSNRGERIATLGMRSLAPDVAIALLFELLKLDAAEVGVFDLDASRWVETQGQRSRALLSELLPEASSPARRAESSFREQLLKEDAGAARQQLLEAHVRETVARVLRLPLARLDVRKPFGSFGLDSLMALELRNRLEQSLGTSLPATVVWTYPTISALSAHLAQKLGILAPPPEDVALLPLPSQPLADTTVHELEQLTDADMAALLAGELDRLEDRRRV